MNEILQVHRFQMVELQYVTTKELAMQSGMNITNR